MTLAPADLLLQWFFAALREGHRMEFARLGFWLDPLADLPPLVCDLPQGGSMATAAGLEWVYLATRLINVLGNDKP